MLKKARRQGKNRQKNLKKRKKNSAISAPIWYNVNNDKNISKGAYCTMINYTTLNSNLKRGILNFSEKISKKFNRPTMKFICNMIFGILASKSCLLSEIGRNLNEKISLSKTVTRLSRNLNDFDGGEELFEAYLKSIKNRYDDKSVLIIDGSDITKPASK